MKNFFLISNLNPPCQLKATSPCPITTYPCKKSLYSFPVGPFRCCKVSPEPSLLLGWTAPALPACLQERCSSTLSIFMASSGLAQTGPWASYVVSPSSGHSSPGGVLSKESRRITSLELLAKLLMRGDRKTPLCGWDKQRVRTGSWAVVTQCSWHDQPLNSNTPQTMFSFYSL